MPTCASGGARRPEPALADQRLDQQDDRQHQHDQHRAVGDGDAVVAVDDAADDVGGRQLVLGGDQEDRPRDTVVIARTKP